MGLFSFSTTVYKTESTSQTMGQLITIPPAPTTTTSTTESRTAVTSPVSTTNSLTLDSVGISKPATSDSVVTLIEIPPPPTTTSSTSTKTPTSSDNLLQAIVNAEITKSPENVIEFVTITDVEKAQIAVAAASPDSGQQSVSVTEKSSTGLLGNELLRATVNAEIIRSPSVVLRHAIVLGSAYKTKEEINKILQESQKVDMMISMKSKPSQAIEFNNLKEVNPKSNFVYNFYIPEEESLSSEEDPSRDPYLVNDIFNVPRYVELNWDIVGVTEYKTLSPNDEKKVDEALKTSVFSSGVETAPLLRDGVTRTVTDLNNLNLAISSTSNRNTFTNTLNGIVNTAFSRLGSFMTIPLKK